MVASDSLPEALLVVDLQQGLFADEPRPARIDAVIATVNALAQRARAAGALVVFIQHESAGGVLVHGSPGWQLDTRLQTVATDLRVYKTTSAPYPSTPLHALLQGHGVRRVAVVGYATEFCVDSTVRWSASLGLEVTLVADAHTTHDKPHLPAAQIVAHHNATLPAITSLGAPIRTAFAAQLWPSN